MAKINTIEEASALARKCSEMVQEFISTNDPKIISILELILLGASVKLSNFYIELAEDIKLGNSYVKISKMLGEILGQSEAFKECLGNDYAEILLVNLVEELDKIAERLDRMI